MLLSAKVGEVDRSKQVIQHRGDIEKLVKILQLQADNDISFYAWLAFEINTVSTVVCNILNYLRSLETWQNLIETDWKIAACQTLKQYWGNFFVFNTCTYIFQLEKINFYRV